ncbi:MAG: DUF3488 and transglutaminase-like domain-containing protein [Pseudomonadales bacterium]|nr:DUF3488 and transglutaminase-like domain-containing protein [Pseudomonadales bacterium]
MSSLSPVTGYEIPRNSLAWMLFAQVAVIAPHLVRLPWWIIMVCFACGFWRVMVYQGRWSYPPRWVKVCFVFSGLIGIPLGYSKIYALEPAIALLVIAFVLKLLEMHHKRDAYIVILLAYFVAITEFLFFQSIPYTLYMFATVVMITTALIGLHQTKSHMKPLQTFRTAVVLLAQSIPLMLVLFVLFPRIAPLWSVPLQTGVAKTGVTDVMSPGDISSLAQSDALAFTATFETDPPPYGALYWRGLVLSEFDGKSWSQAPDLRRSIWRQGEAPPEWSNNLSYIGKSYNYSIIMEPNQQSWLFSLAMPVLPANRDYVILRDFRLAAVKPVRQRIRYALRSSLEYRIDPQLTNFYRYRYTRIPAQSNPQSQSLAKKMYREASSPQGYINDVLRMYHFEEFVYTLKPPLLGGESIDEFLLQSRRGFCEHFAGSFVFLMRAAGIPARVVLGYQGGEYNPSGKYVAVRQFDAHAWAEVWLEDKGWVRFDPTSAVAPERVERGLEAAVAGENTFLEGSPLSIFRYRQLLWLTELRLQLGSIAYYWDSWVVGYTPDRQMSLLSKYFDRMNRQRLGSIMLAVFFTVLGLLAVFILRKRSRAVVAPLDAEFLKFCRLMQKRGCARKTGEGPFDYGARLALYTPELATEIDSVVSEYVRLNYSCAGNNSAQPNIKSLRQMVRALKIRALTTRV